MSHPELLKQKFSKTGVQRAEPSAGVRGTLSGGQCVGAPEKPFFLFLLAAAGGERGKKEFGETPKPRQGGPCTP